MVGVKPCHQAPLTRRLWTFGYLRPPRGTADAQGDRLGGFVAIDSLTGFALCHLAKVQDQFLALEALKTYVEKAPFPVHGLLLSDNATCFLAETFLKGACELGFLQRTIRSSHPWSNGKVEALNRVLKYQCFAAIAGNISDWKSACTLVERWMNYYNTQRSHSGHVNRGIPPVAFYELHKKTEGDHLGKLLKSPNPDCHCVTEPNERLVLAK